MLEVNLQQSLGILEQKFRKLIIEQCKFCRFDKYLAEHPDFEFPKLTSELLNQDSEQRITIPGLFGGFGYFLETVNDEPVLYAEQSSRMDYSSDDYRYFEITTNGSKLLKGAERQEIQQRFRELDHKMHTEHLQKCK